MLAVWRLIMIKYHTKALTLCTRERCFILIVLGNGEWMLFNFWVKTFLEVLLRIRSCWDYVIFSTSFSIPYHVQYKPDCSVICCQRGFSILYKTKRFTKLLFILIKHKKPTHSYDTSFSSDSDDPDNPQLSGSVCEGAELPSQWDQPHHLQLTGEVGRISSKQ